MSHTNKQIVEKVNAAFTNNDIEGFLAFCADDVRWTMVGDTSIKGKDGIRQWMGKMPSEAPQFTVQHTIADGDLVACHGDMTMKEQGEAVPYAYCDIYRFNGDKIVEMHSFVMKTAAQKKVAGASA